MYISNNGFSNLFPSAYLNFHAPDVVLSRAEVLCVTGVHLTDRPFHGAHLWCYSQKSLSNPMSPGLVSTLSSRFFQNFVLQLGLQPIFHLSFKKRLGICLNLFRRMTYSFVLIAINEKINCLCLLYNNCSSSKDKLGAREMIWSLRALTALGLGFSSQNLYQKAHNSL